MYQYGYSLRDKAKRIKDFANSNRLLLVSSLGLTFLNLFAHSWMLFIPSILLSGLLVGRSLKIKYFRSLFSSSLLGVSIVFLVVSAVSLIAWALNMRISLDALYIISLLLSIVYSSLSSDDTPTTTKTIDVFDLVSIAVITIYVGIFCVGAIRSKTTEMTVLTVVQQSASFGIDDLSHNNMVKDILEADRGLLLGSKNKDQISKTDNISYPKMSHLVGATLISQSVSLGSHRSNTNGLFFASYSLMKVAVFLVTFCFMIRSSLEIGFKKNKRHYSLLALTPLLLVLVLFAHSFFQEGFYSVWPVLLYSPLLLLIISKESRWSQHIRTLLSLMFVIITASWPIYGVPIGVILLIDTISLVRTRTTIRRLLFDMLPYLLIAPLGLIQIYVQLFDSAPINSSQINASGGIVSFPLLVFGILSLATCFWLSQLQSTSKRPYSVTTAYLSTILLTNIAIGLSNISGTGSLQYFFIKSAYICMLLCSVVVIGYFANSTADRFYTKGLSNYRFVVGMTLTIAALCVTVFTLYADSGYTKYAGGYLVSGRRNISTHSLVSQLEGSEPKVVINLDSKLETYYLSTLSRSLNHFDYCMGEIFSYVSEPSGSNLESCGTDDHLALTVIDNPKVDNQIQEKNVSQLAETLKSKGVLVSDSSN